MDAYRKMYPVLGEAHQAKESFHAIYDKASSRQEAKIKYNKWLVGLIPQMVEAYSPLIKAMNSWDTEIFNYFEYRITNAFTESLNKLVRVMNSLGHGYTFEVLRAKILFTEGLHTKKVKRPKFQPKDQNGWGYRQIELIKPDEIINYGVDLDKLTQWIEEGRF
jgi:hypothetical protein